MATSKDIKQITRANKEHSNAAAKLTGQLGEVRRITQRNAAGVKETRGSTSDLIEQARALGAVVEGVAKRRVPTNGRGTRSSHHR